MSAIGGPNIVEDGLVFYYDTGNTVKSYIGEPNTNYIHHQNAVAQDVYTPYVWSTSGTWQAKHTKAIRAYNAAGGGITGYVNGGVSDPTNKHHAHWQYDDILKKPVVVMEDFDASWKAKSYGTGISSWQSLGKSVGDTYTISWLQWTDNLSKSARVGLYTRNPSGTPNFWDGLLASATAKNTELRTWQRVYQTYTTSSNRNLSDAYAIIYMYGHYDARATIKIADVQFDWGAHPKQFSPNPTRSVTESLLDLTGNSTIDLSSVSFDSNAQMTFDGTSDEISININSWIRTVDDITVEGVVEIPAGAPVTGGPWGILTDHSTNSEKDGFWWHMSLSGNTFFRVEDTVYGERGITFSNPSTFSAGTTYHIVTVVGSNGVFLYNNGVLVETYNPPFSWANISAAHVASLVIGRTFPGYYLNSNIHRLKVYNRALTQQEIQQNYTATKSRFGL